MPSNVSEVRGQSFPRRPSRIMLVTFVSTFAAMSLAAVAALRTTTTAVPCGDTYFLTATSGSVNWTAAPWGGIGTDPFPGATATNDCATIQAGNVALTDPIQVAGVSVTSTGLAVELRIAGGGSLNVLGNGTVAGTSTTGTGRIRVDTGGALTISDGLQNVNANGEIDVSNGVLSVIANGALSINSGGRLTVGNSSGSIGTVTTSNNGIKVAAGADANVWAGTLNGGGSWTVGELAPAATSELTIGYPGPVVIDATTVNVAQDGLLSVWATPFGTNSLANGAQLNINSGGTLVFPTLFAMAQRGISSGAGTGQNVAVNGGVITVTATGPSFIDVPVLNAGTVILAAPNTNLQLNGGGNHSGDFIANDLLSTLAFAGNHVINAGTMTGPGAIANNGNLDWEGGTLSGTGSFVNTATMDFAGGNVVIDGRTLQNNNLLDWTGNANIDIRNSGAIVNNAAGTFLAQVDQEFQSTAGTGTVVNLGTLTKASGGDTIFQPGVALQNNATIDVQSGAFQVNSNSTNAGLINISGPLAEFRVGAPGSFALQNGTSILGSGLFHVNGGNLALLTTGAVTMPNGKLDLGGSIQGPVDLIVSNAFHWASGSMAGGAMTRIDGTLLIDGAGAVLNNRILANNGNTVWSGAGSIELSNDGRIQNGAGRIFEIQNNSSLFYGAGTVGRIDNDGIFRKTGGAGTTTVNSIPFHNNGAVEIQSGVLSVSGVGSTAGSHDIGAASKLVMAGSYTVNNGATFTGGGTLELSGNLFIASASPIVVPHLHQTGGTVSGAGTLQIPAGGSFDWDGGSHITAGGSTVIDPGATVNISGTDKILDQRSFNNDGSINWTGSKLQLASSTFTNGPSGSIAITGAIPVLMDVSGSGGFNNDGVLQKTVDTGVTTISSIPFSNNGSLDIQSGALEITGAYVQSPAASVSMLLGGPTPLTQYSQLRLAANPTLDGLLAVGLNSYTPVDGDTFQVLPIAGGGAHTGDFASRSLPALPPGFVWLESYDANGLLLEVAGTSSSLVVTNLNDSGPGSLRQALTDVVAGLCTPCTITFAVPSPGAIAITSQLPITTTPVIIDGTSQPGYAGAPLIGVDGSGCAGCDGITLQGSGSAIHGLAIYNFSGGGALWLEVGGNASATRNWIGVNLAGASAPNLGGVVLDNSSGNIVENNKIAGNTIGVVVLSGTGHAIKMNSMSGNGFGIDLNGDGSTANDAGDADIGPNNLQNKPVINSVTAGSPDTINVSVDSASTSTSSLRVEIFRADAAGQGQTFLGQQCFAGNAITSQNISLASNLQVGQSIVATATSYAGTGCTTIADGTSEFSDAFTVACGPSTASISGAATYCAGDRAILLRIVGSDVSSVLWSTGSTATSILVTPASTRTYTAQVTSSSGCTATLSHTVEVLRPAGDADIVAPATLTADSVGNTASVALAGDSYTWSIVNGVITSGQGTSSITFNAGSAGSVELSVSVDTGTPCPSRDSVTRPIISCATEPPAILAPAAGASSPSPITFSWTAVPNAIGYDVWRLENGAPAFIGSTSATVTTLTASLPSGTFSWYVEARLTATCIPDRLASEIRELTVLPATNCPSAAPRLIRPVEGSTFSPATFEWTGVEGALGYRIMASLGDLPATEIASTNAGTTQLLAELPVGSVRWWVEAIYEGCSPVASEQGVFNVELESCDKHVAPAQIAPAEGATPEIASVTFAWTAVDGADGYTVWLERGNERRAVGTTLAEPALTAVVDPGAYDWFVEAKFEGCPSTESAKRRLVIRESATCGSTIPVQSAPSNGATVSSPRVTFTWSGVPHALLYEVWLSVASGAPALIASTDTTSLTADVPEGEIEWFVRARLNGCSPRESIRRSLRFVLPSACRSAVPMLLLPLDDGRPIVSPARFRWTGVPGATRYNLYIGRHDEDPELRATTTTPEVDGVTVPNGESEWFVEAQFDGCPATRSSVGRFVSVPNPPTCITPAQPVISVPGQVSADTSYVVQWTSVPGAEYYVLTEFAGGIARALTVQGQSATFVYPNDTGEPITYIYNVRGVDSDCGTAGQGASSAALGVTILPERAAEGSSVIGAHDSLQQVIPISSDFAGQTFVATSAQPWITISPSTGTVPPGGIDLIVTVNTTDLPLGTSVAGVTISFGSPSAGRQTTSGSSSSSNATVSINLVTPVTPTPKSAPPPDALIIPAVAHAEGVNAVFRSDVRVSNTSPQVMKYQITFVPSGEAGMTQGRQTMLEILPGRTIALDDVLRTWFGTAGSGLLGTLEIRPLTQSSSSTSSAAVRGVPDFVTFASSRTFNQTPDGTFGTFIAAIPFANFAGGATDSTPATTLSLQQIAQSAQYRTNLGFVEGSGNPVELLVSVFDTAGTKVTDFPVGLSGGQHLQIGSFLAERGISLDDGRVEVEVAAGTGKVTAYAAVVNNATGDSLVVTPATLGQTGSSKYVLPGVAELTGGFTWQTDARLFNAGDESVTATLTLQSLNGNPPQQTTLELPPGQIRRLDRVLATLFGVSNDGGALHIEVPEGSDLVATARTYRPAAGEGANFGQFIQAVTPDEAIGAGSRPLQILQVEESSRFRSNIGIAEVSGKPATVEVTIIPPDSKVSARLQVDMGPNQFRQLNSLLSAMGMGGTHNARVSVRVISGEGRITAYAATIDSVTQDPTFIPAQ